MSIIPTKLIQTFINNKNRNQYFAVSWVNLLTCCYGSCIGWLSPALLILMSDESPLINGKISVEEASWIGSWLAAGSITGNIAFSIIGSKFGRKNTFAILVIPQIIFCVIIKFSKQIEYIYIARFIAGFTGGGCFSCVPLYVSEIASPEIRGKLGNLFNIIFAIGILFGLTIGAYIEFYTIPIIMLVLPVIAFIGLLFLPETPQFFLQQNKIKEAEKSLRFYRNHGLNCTNVKANDEFQMELIKLKTNIHQDDNSPKKWKFCDFCTSTSFSSFFCGFSIVFVQQFSGVIHLLNYGGIIFKLSGSDMDPNTCAIVIGIMQIISGFINAILVDRVGRKILFVTTALASSIGQAIMSLYTYFNYIGYDLSSFNWLPVTCMSFVILVASSGFMSLAIVLIPEVFPLKLREFGASLCLILLATCFFLSLKMFPILLEIIGFHSFTCFYSIVCLLGALLGIFVLRETKGVDINIIENGK